MIESEAGSSRLLPIDVLVPTPWYFAAANPQIGHTAPPSYDEIVDHIAPDDDAGRHLLLK